MSEDDIRIDKWLWAVRIYKTRTIAIDECKKGRVVINGVAVKPSRSIHVGELINIKKPPVVYTYKIKGILDRRVSAQVVKDYMEDMTSSEELNKLLISKTDINFRRERGTGRPTKKERRSLDNFKDND